MLTYLIIILCHHISARLSSSPIYLHNIHKTKIESNNVSVSNTNKNKLLITLPTSTFYLNREFIE